MQPYHILKNRSLWILLRDNHSLSLQDLGPRMMQSYHILEDRSFWILLRDNHSLSLLDLGPRMMQSCFFLGDISLRITLGQVSKDDTIPLQHHCSPFWGRSFRTTPSLSRKYSNFIRDRGFVNTSTTFSSVLTQWSFMAPFYIISRMQKYHMFMCFDLLWNIGFSVIFIQLWLSHRITMVSKSMLNKLDISF